MVVIQEETTGCGIACVANIIERPYADVKAKANSMGILLMMNHYTQILYMFVILSKSMAFKHLILKCLLSHGKRYPVWRY